MRKLVMLAFFFIFGCSVAPFVVSPIITGVIIWKQAEAHKYYKEELKIIYRATKNSLKELGHSISTDEKTRDGYYILAGSKNEFKIHIRQVKPNISEVAIRINILGDKPYAELLYSTIDANTNTINYNEEGVPTINKDRRKSAYLSR
jgi:hypothetical protein